jgi:hypothetical protein
LSLTGDKSILQLETDKCIRIFAADYGDELKVVHGGYSNRANHEKSDFVFAKQLERETHYSAEE